MACFVSYIYMFALLRKRRVFLQLWLLFIDKDIARAYVAVAGGRRRAEAIVGCGCLRYAADVMRRKKFRK